MGWVAAPFFVSFIILSSLVVLNLFIGVIISNMNDARATLQKVTLQPITVATPNDVNLWVVALCCADPDHVLL